MNTQLDNSIATFQDAEFALDQPHQPTTINSSVNPTPTANHSEDGLLDLGDEASLDRLSQGGLLRLRPEGQNVISVALCNTAVIEKTHYAPAQNKVFRCLQQPNGFCCEKLSDPREVVGVLAIQYFGASPKDGSFKKGTDPELKVGFVNLSKSALGSMRKALPEGSTLYSTDWKMWKKSNGIGFEYAVQRTTPLYKTLGLEQQVAELIAPYRDGTKLRKRVAKPMTAVEVRMLLTGEVPDDEKTMGDVDTM